MANTQKNFTLAEGRTVSNPTASLQIQRPGGGGLLLLQDTQLIETLAHFNRERIPERVVHAQAAGAFGTFEVTHDVSDITSANFLNGIGKKTDVAVRISTVGPERGGSDVIRDVRGFAIKFFTGEGNQDWVFNDMPMFFIRDPIKFPSVNRSHKRHPQTNLVDPNMFWDFHVHNQEGIHALMFLLSDRGTPASLRNIDGFSGHTYKFTKEDGSFNYVKIHLKTDQGIRNLTKQESTRLMGEDPDHHTRDLFESIEHGNYPSWTVCVQVMSPEEAERYRFNVFDMTKVWPHADFPLRPIGKMTLNKNPSNYFQDIEQLAFSPSTMVPGIAPSADPMLQARMFAYPDAARHRLGPNYQQLPPNAAKCPVYSPYERDGFPSFKGNYGADPSYVTYQKAPNTVNGANKSSHDIWTGQVTEFSSEVTDIDFVQARDLWRVLGRQPGQQEHLVENAAESIVGAQKDLREKAYEMFARVDVQLGRLIESTVQQILQRKGSSE